MVDFNRSCTCGDGEVAANYLLEWGKVQSVVQIKKKDDRIVLQSESISLSINKLVVTHFVDLGEMMNEKGDIQESIMYSLCIQGEMTNGDQTTIGMCIQKIGNEYQNFVVNGPLNPILGRLELILSARL